MGIYSDGKIYGVSWYHTQNSSIEEYVKQSPVALTDEERQEVYDDFLRLVPDAERPLYSFRVFTHSVSTYEPVSENSYFGSWFPLDYRYLLEYFENGSIVGF